MITRAKGFFIPVLLFLFSCGIEDYPYLYPIPYLSDSARETNQRVSFYIPDENLGLYFTHFEILYKIYLSNNDELQPSKNNFVSVSQTLNNDFLRIEPYTNDTRYSSSIYSDFKNWGFYSIDSLKKANNDIVNSRNELDVTVFLNYIDILFPDAGVPVMVIKNSGGTVLETYSLLRSSLLSLPPDNDRLFLNDFLETDGSILSYNSDVVSFTGFNPDLDIYSYACLYIIACGQNPQTYVPVYSSPTFLHVFQLPQP